MLKFKYFHYIFLWLVALTIFLLCFLIEWTPISELNLVTRKELQEQYNQFIKNYEPFCGPYSLDGNTTLPQCSNCTLRNISRANCSLPSISQFGCRNIYMNFHQTTAIPKCPAETAVDFCKVSLAANDDRVDHQLSILCDFSACSKGTYIRIGVLNAHSGSLDWHYFTYLSISKRSVSDLAHSSLRQRNPFVFIECDIDRVLLTQLLVLPPHYGDSFHPPLKHSPANAININLILIDSVSRSHFYRMMPKTIHYLQRLHCKGFEVLDFELFHSIKERTFEHLKAFFEGKIYETDEAFDRNPTPPTAVNFKLLLNMFKESGYDTLYQEDLCWEYDWGLIKDSGIYAKKIPKNRRFSALMEVLQNNRMDSLGLTHSTCEIFHRFGIIDHFNYRGRLCFGGHYQHDYFLEHLKEALKLHNGRPLLSFLLINVGHEGTGKRIRTFDHSLVKFLSSTDTFQNTIHILFSDHGNSYGAFANTAEGRVETFHPFLFMLVPTTISDLLGRERMQNLRGNQKMLLNIIDLHYTIIDLLNLSAKRHPMNGISAHSKNGLFSPISSSRSCHDLHLLRSSLCFCTGWKSYLPTVSTHYLIAEFVLAKINSKIVKIQQMQPVSVRSCQRIIGISVSNVWQKTVSNKILIGLDIWTQDDNLFSAIVSCMLESEELFDMRVISIKRRSSYGVYRSCANDKVPLEFCICSRRYPPNKASFQNLLDSSISSMFTVQTKSSGIHDNCLYILTRSYKAGVVFEASNACHNITYAVKMNFKLNNMKLASRSYQRAVLPGSVASLAIAIMHMPGLEWSYEYTSDIAWQQV